MTLQFYPIERSGFALTAKPISPCRERESRSSGGSVLAQPGDNRQRGVVFSRARDRPRNLELSDGQIPISVD